MDPGHAGTVKTPKAEVQELLGMGSGLVQGVSEAKTMLQERSTLQVRLREQRMSVHEHVYILLCDSGEWRLCRM